MNDAGITDSIYVAYVYAWKSVMGSARASLSYRRSGRGVRRFLRSRGASCVSTSRLRRRTTSDAREGAAINQGRKRKEKDGKARERDRASALSCIYNRTMPNAAERTDRRDVLEILINPRIERDPSDAGDESHPAL